MGSQERKNNSVLFQSVNVFPMSKKRLVSENLVLERTTWRGLREGGNGNLRQAS